MASLTTLFRSLTLSLPIIRSSPSASASTHARTLLIASTSSSSSSTSQFLLNSQRSYATASSSSSAGQLGNLSPAPGSSFKRKRIGRGIGSGRGGTSGRGHKGQGARSGNGKPALHFAGGQTPITRAYPKRGFTNTERQEFTPLNLNRLRHWIERGLIDPTRPITMKELRDSKCVHGIKHGVKLLGEGSEEWDIPNVEIIVSRASQSAIQAIEAQNGTLISRYENRLTLRALLNPDSFYKKGLPIPSKADPIKRRDLLFYSDAEKNRGYLGLIAMAEREARMESGMSEEGSTGGDVEGSEGGNDQSEVVEATQKEI